MKKILINILTFVIVLAVIVVLFLSLGSEEGARYVYKGNTEHKAVAVKPKEYQCSECNMDIEALEYLAEVITEEGDTYFFDEIGCLVLWLKNHHPKIHSILTQTLDTHRWIDAKKAWYTRRAHTPMGYGFAAFEVKKDGFIDYDEMKLLMLQGKNLHDPFVKKKLFEQQK